MEQVLCCVNLSNFRDTVVDDRVACDDDTWLAEGHVSRGHRSLAGAIDGDLVGTDASVSLLHADITNER